MSFAGVLIELEALETAGVVTRTARGVVLTSCPEQVGIEPEVGRTPLCGHDCPP
jgi:hypothetical protein